MTLEASLNLLWALLAAGILIHWKKPDGGHRRGHLPGLVSLIFILALLFPVISANDDLARLELINDAKTSQSIAMSVKKDKQQCALAELLILFPVSTVQLVSSVVPVSFESPSEPNRIASVDTPGGATGNHSPPLC